MLHADPLGILALIAVAMCWSLSVVLFRVGMRGSVARKLALVLVVEGVALVSCGLIEYLFTVPDDFYQRNPGFAIIETIVHGFGDCGMLARNPPFLPPPRKVDWTRRLLHAAT